MRTLLCFVFALFSLKSTGQDYRSIDKHALATPENVTHSVKSLSAYLCGPPARNDAERLRAIYVWITQNITYKDSTSGSEWWSTPADIRRQRAENVLLNRSAVCLGYSNLFQALATANEIPCEVISGIVRDPVDGEIARIGHAWIAAKVGQEWHLFDPTWGIPPGPPYRGRIDERYFMAQPEVFAINHLPDDPLWQFLENPLHEHQFRTSSDATLKAIIAQPAEKPFQYKDTLATWLRLDTASRTHQSVFRTLHFNAGNERVIFQLGRTFYKDFFELKFTLDSISNEHIFTLKTRIDTVHFLKQVARLEAYHRRASALFAQLRSPERIERAGKLFTPDQMTAIVAKMRGDMYMALFQYMLDKESDITTTKQLQNLQYAADKVQFWHAKALPAFTIDSLFGEDRRDIWNLQSQAAWQIGNRHLRLAQNYINDEAWQRKHPGVLDRTVERSKTALERADSLALLLFSKPWYARTIRERLTSIRKGRVTAAVLNIRLREQDWKNKADALTKQPFLTAKEIKPLQAAARTIRQATAEVLDSLQHPQLPYDEAFTRSMSTNLYSDVYELHLREGELFYRVAFFAYNKAVEDRNMENQKAAIMEYANEALTCFKYANKTLTDMEKSNKTETAIIATGRKQVAELRKAVEDIKASLE